MTAYIAKVKPSGKMAGGQNGHQGTHLAVITAPDKIVKHMPSACEGCPHYQICKGTAFFYVFSKPRLRTTSNNNFFITQFCIIRYF
ncbi:MAG: hypothetical protein EGP77_00005 [Lachnospiraceae bacterium]|nr:hypothetical protein [Lachnospiraceae bacterium]